MFDTRRIVKADKKISKQKKSFLGKKTMVHKIKWAVGCYFKANFCWLWIFSWICRKKRYINLIDSFLNSPRRPRLSAYGLLAPTMPPKHSFWRAQYGLSRWVLPSLSTMHHSQSNTPKQSLKHRTEHKNINMEVLHQDEIFPEGGCSRFSTVWGNPQDFPFCGNLPLNGNMILKAINISFTTGLYRHI